MGQTAAERKWHKRQEHAPDFDGLDWFVVKSNIKCEERAALSLSEAGFFPYVPKMQFEVVHHRTKKHLDKTANLFRQYVFVGMPKPHQWGFLRACDGVERVLGTDGEGGQLPMQIPASAVRSFWDREHNLEFDNTETAKVHRGEIIKDAKRTVNVTLPNGMIAKVRAREVPFMDKIPVGSREPVKVVLEIFGAMTEVTIPYAEIEKVFDAA